MSETSIERLVPRSASFSRFTPRDLATSFFLYRRIILIAFLVPCVLGIVFGRMAHTSFNAQARLLILYGSDYVFHPGNRDTGNDITLDRNEIIEGELQILESPALASETLQALGPQSIYPGIKPGPIMLQTAVNRFLSDLVATSVPQSNVIQLTLRNPNRETAVRALDTLISHYIAFRSRVFGKAAAPVDPTRNEFAIRLKSVENNLADFARIHRIGNLDEQMSLALRQEAAVADDQRSTDEQIGTATAELNTLRDDMRNVAKTVEVFQESERSQESTALTASLVKLEMQRRELIGRYRDGYPVIVDLDRQIADLRKQIAAKPVREDGTQRVGRNDVYDQFQQRAVGLETQLRGLSAKKQVLQLEANRLQARSSELIGLGQHYQELQRTRDVLDQAYRRIAQSAEETGFAGSLERAGGANVRVIQPADAPVTGHNVGALVTLAGVIFGGLLSLAALALLIATRQVMVTVHDAEQQLGLPVLVAVPLRELPRTVTGVGADSMVSQ